MLRVLFITAIGFLFAFSNPASATVVLAAQTATTDLGLFSAGTYQITASGVVDIASPVVQHHFNLDPTGTPPAGFPIDSPGYAAYATTGVLQDPFSLNQPGQGYGVSGPLAKLGALLGSFVPNPVTTQLNPIVTDFFLIGFGTTVTLQTDGHIYALVNDVAGTYGNNFGSFDVTVTGVSAVPEASTWAMIILGFGGVTFMAYCRKSKPALMAA